MQVKKPKTRNDELVDESSPYVFEIVATEPEWRGR